MSRKERTWSVLKGLAMLAGGIFLLILENMWFQEQGKRGSRKYSHRRLSGCCRFGFADSGSSISVGWMQKKEKICTKRNDTDSMPLLRRQCAGQRTNLPNLRKEYV